MHIHGFPVALAQDLANLRKELYDQITYQVREQFLSQFQQSATSSDITFVSTVQTMTTGQMNTATRPPTEAGARKENATFIGPTRASEDRQATMSA